MSLFNFLRNMTFLIIFVILYEYYWYILKNKYTGIIITIIIILYVKYSSHFNDYIKFNMNFFNYLKFIIYLMFNLTLREYFSYILKNQYTAFILFFIIFSCAEYLCEDEEYARALQL